MITFYPGPSKLYPKIEGYLNDAFHSGLLSMNHRSKPFMEMLSETDALLKRKLDIPDSYEIVFVSSATECWEIIAQSLTERNSYHLYNGAFGAKWQEYAHRIHGRSIGRAYAIDDQPKVVFPDHLPSDLLCVTHTETSNGTTVADTTLSELRGEFKGLIAVDATSSMAGVALPWQKADVWYASVQKCFGLPSGLAVMVLSPDAASAVARIGESAHYNSLGFVMDNFRKFQTPYTPNILGIFLLKRLMEDLEANNETSKKLELRAASLYEYLEGSGFSPLVRSEASRSSTVLAVKDSKENIAALKVFASERGIVLGNGYGEWKDTTFRIANFPAVDEGEIAELKNCLNEFKRK